MPGIAGACISATIEDFIEYMHRLCGYIDHIPTAFCNDPHLMSLQLSEGSGSILVVAVGVNSEYGKTMSLVMTEAASTPLQEHLEVLAASIGKVGFVVAVICFVVLLIR